MDLSQSKGCSTEPSHKENKEKVARENNGKSQNLGILENQEKLINTSENQGKLELEGSLENETKLINNKILVNEGKLENDGNSENQGEIDIVSKVKEVLHKAIVCCDDGNLKGVLVLIDTAKGLIVKNEISGKQENHVEYTMVHEEIEIPKVPEPEHSVTTRTGRSQEAGKPEYSLSDVASITKDDSKINANNYENTENKASDSSNSTFVKERADCCLKVAQDAFEAKDIEKAERLATKADRMLQSEESKTILAKVLQMKASSVKQRDNNGQNTNDSAAEIIFFEKVNNMDNTDVSQSEKCSTEPSHEGKWENEEILEKDVKLENNGKTKNLGILENQEILMNTSKNQGKLEHEGTQENEKKLINNEILVNKGKLESNGNSENEGEIENNGKSDIASKVKQLLNKAIVCCDDNDFKGVLVLIDTAKGLIVKNEVSENHADYTMVHEELEIPKVHKPEHSVTTRGRSEEVRKPEHYSMTTRGRGEEVRKPEYSLRTREKSVVRPKKDDSNINANNSEYKKDDSNINANNSEDKKDDSNINANNSEDKKDDSSINANNNANKENKSSDSPNGTANREEADFCLKCAKDAFEAKDIEKAEKLATKNEVSENQADYTMVHEELEIPKVHKPEHSVTTRGRSEEVRKPEHYSMTTRGRGEEVRKPEYSLRTREKSVVRPKKDDSNINANNSEDKKDDSNINANNSEDKKDDSNINANNSEDKKDDSNINANNSEDKKDDSSINANNNANKENKSSDSPNGTANREQADYCLKCAKDTFEAKDIEKAERLAAKADIMFPSEESKTILAKVLQMKASRQQDNNGQNTKYYSADKEEAQRSIEIAFTAHEKGDIDKCRRFLRKAQKFDRSIDIELYMCDLDQKKRDQEDAERAKVQEEQRKAAESAKLQEEKRRAFERAKKSFDIIIGSGDTEETKSAQDYTKKGYSSYKDNPSSPKAQNKRENDGQEAGALAGAQTDIDTEQGAAKGNASGKTGSGKEPQNERKTVLKAKQLENKAMACYDVGDYKTALVLLDAALVISPDKRQIQDFMVQVQYAAKTRKQSISQPKNPRYEEPKEAKYLAEMGARAYRNKEFIEAEKFLMASDRLYSNVSVLKWINDIRKEKN